MSTARRRTLQIDDPLAPITGREPDASSRQTDGPKSEQHERLTDIPLGQIQANPHQPRKRFDDDSIASLAESIRERGVLQPIIVRPIKHGYQLVAGERRWRAAELAGEATVPALVDDAVDEAGSLELALIENIVREDLTPIEEARTLATLLDDLRVTSTVLAKRLGRSRPDIANTMRLLELPDEAIELIDCGALSKGHGKALLAEPDHHRRRVLARRAAERGWSVRALEAEIARAATQRKPRPMPRPDQTVLAAEFEAVLVKAIGREARVRPHQHGFQIILDQSAAECLARTLAGETVTW
jgi:ParB family transcriptional regulator, chromosome partitioning protein